MNFTREPIIETIISPKEGYKLLVRNSKSSSSTEEFFVDAVEVVSFGHGYFFRSMERPKAFLVPVSDYEILEVKETRVALKNVSHERNIKIGGGREAPLRHTHREPAQEKERESEVAAEEVTAVTAEEAGLETAISSRMEKRRDRRRRRHRRSSEEQEWNERRAAEKAETPQSESEPNTQGGGPEDEAKVSSPMFSSLIPPPPKLISETLSRYKDKEFVDSDHFKEIEKKEKRKEEEKKKENPPEQDDSNSESSPLHRVAPVSLNETLEVSSLNTTTNFSILPGGNDPYFY